MKTALLYTSLLVSLIANAQDSMNTKKGVSLYGFLTYDFPNGYGFTIGGSIPFKSIGKSPLHDSKSTKFISTELGESRYPFAYTSIFANAGIGILYVRSPKHFTELCFHQGILRTVYDGKVYELDANGNVKEHRLAGRTYLTSGFSYSWNWTLSRANSNLWLIQFRPFAWAQYPYNSFLKFHFSLQAGISYCFRNRRSIL